MEETKPQTKDWKISELYEKAWEIVKKHKVLWLFGLAVAGFGSSFNNSNYNFNSDELERIFEKNPESSNQISQVLGAATNDQLFNLLATALSQVPTFLWVLLAIEVLLLIGFWVTVGLIHAAWVNGSLLAGSQIGAENGEVSIKNCSERSFPALKGLIWLSVVPGLLLTLAIIVVFGLLTLGIALSPSFLKIVFSLLLVVALLLAVYAFIYLLLSSIWAMRKIVFEKTPARQALIDGYHIAQKKKWSMILLGLVNNILAGIVIFVPAAIFAGVLVMGVMAGLANNNLYPGLIALGVLFAITFIIGITLLSGVLNAFKAVVWTLAYNQIKGKYDK